MPTVLLTNKHDASLDNSLEGLLKAYPDESDNRVWKTVRRRIERQQEELPLLQDPQFVIPVGVAIEVGGVILIGMALQSFTMGNMLNDFVPSRIARIGLPFIAVAAMGGAGVWMVSSYEKGVGGQCSELRRKTHYSFEFKELTQWEADALKGEPLAAVLKSDLRHLESGDVYFRGSYQKFVEAHSIRVFSYLPEEIGTQFRRDATSQLKKGAISLAELGQTERNFCIQIGITDADIAERVVRDVSKLTMRRFAEQYGNRWRNIAAPHNVAVMRAMEARLSTGWGEEILGRPYPDDDLNTLGLTQKYREYIANNITQCEPTQFATWLPRLEKLPDTHQRQIHAAVIAQFNRWMEATKPNQATLETMLGHLDDTSGIDVESYLVSQMTDYQVFTDRFPQLANLERHLPGNGLNLVNSLYAKLAETKTAAELLEAGFLGANAAEAHNGILQVLVSQAQNPIQFVERHGLHWLKLPPQRHAPIRGVLRNHLNGDEFPQNLQKLADFNAVQFRLSCALGLDNHLPLMRQLEDFTGQTPASYQARVGTVWLEVLPTDVINQQKDRLREWLKANDFGDTTEFEATYGLNDE